MGCGTEAHSDSTGQQLAKHFDTTAERGAGLRGGLSCLWMPLSRRAEVKGVVPASPVDSLWQQVGVGKACAWEQLEVPRNR